MFKIYSDITVTRRKRMHIIQDDTGERVFHAMVISDCLAWLWEHDVRTFIVNDGKQEWTIGLDFVKKAPVDDNDPRHPFL